MAGGPNRLGHRDYHALRHYGRASYDFGDVPLTDVAASIARMGGTIQDAERLLL